MIRDKNQYLKAFKASRYYQQHTATSLLHSHKHPSGPTNINSTKTYFIMSRQTVTTSITKIKK